MEKFEIKNAIIESATLTRGNRGILSAYIGLDYGGSGQSFGGFALYLPKSFDHHKLESCAGHFVYRVLEVAGVDEWSALKGRTIRADCSHCEVRRIGHIVKDDWFCPKIDFAGLEKTS